MNKHILSQLGTAFLGSLIFITSAGCSTYLICAKPPIRQPSGFPYPNGPSFDSQTRGIFIPVHLDNRNRENQDDASGPPYQCSIETGFSKCKARFNALKKLGGFEAHSFACLPISSIESAQLLVHGFRPGPNAGIPDRLAQNQHGRGEGSQSEKREKSTIVFYPIENEAKNPPACVCENSFPSSYPVAPQQPIDVRHFIQSNFPSRIDLHPAGELLARIEGCAKDSGVNNMNTSPAAPAINNHIYNTPPAAISKKDEPLELESFELSLGPGGRVTGILIELRGNLGLIGKLTLKRLKSSTSQASCLAISRLSSGDEYSQLQAALECHGKEEKCDELKYIRTSSNTLLVDLRSLSSLPPWILLEGLQKKIKSPTSGNDTQAGTSHQAETVVPILKLIKLESSCDTAGANATASPVSVSVPDSPSQSRQRD